jgi:putative oxidoreductase
MDRKWSSGGEIMNRVMNHSWTQWALRLAVGGVFVYAGILKIRDPQTFADGIATFHLLSFRWINILALSLPYFEVTVGAMLLVGWRRRPAALAVAGMTVMFAFALSYALAKGLEINCGCFGGGKPSVFGIWTALGRDILLLISAVVIYRHVSLRDHAFQS